LTTITSLFVRDASGRPVSSRLEALEKAAQAGADAPIGPRMERLQQLLGNRYRLEHFLGRGGAATVFKVTRLDLMRVEALKVLAEQYDNEPEFARRFIQEARVAALLDHPNIVKIYDFGQVEGIFWYTMQYIEGNSLAVLITSTAPMAASAAARLMLPILEALDYSHQRGIVHRDIKPGNILLDQRNCPHLADFGIAKSRESLLRTVTGHFVGTPAYISPEQASGKPIDGRADLYSLGVVLYEMLTGVSPFPSENMIETVVMRMTLDPKPIQELRPDLDPDLAAIVMRCLARDREARFATAAAMGQHLIRFLEKRVSDTATTLIGPLHLPGAAAIPDPEKDRATLVEPVAPGEAAVIPAAPAPPVSVPPVRRPRRELRPWARVTIPVVLAATAGFLWLGRPERNANRALSPSPNETAVSRPPGPDKAPDGPSAPLASVRSEGTPAEPQTAEPRREERPVATSPRPAGVSPAAPGGRVTVPEPDGRPSGPAAGVPVRPPVLLETVTARLPVNLSASCAGQILNLSLRVGADGRVRQARVISKGYAPECAEAARAAAIQYRYEPARDITGAAVEATVWVAVELMGGAP